jgi:hypothetical protein
VNPGTERWNSNWYRGTSSTQNRTNASASANRSRAGSSVTGKPAFTSTKARAASANMASKIAFFDSKYA